MTLVLNEEIPDKDVRIFQCIPLMLQHACRTVFIWDVKTDSPLKQLEVGQAQLTNVAISLDGSQIAADNELGIKIIDINIHRQIASYNDNLWTYDSTSQLVWLPDVQFSTSASEEILVFQEDRKSLFIVVNSCPQSQSTRPCFYYKICPRSSDLSKFVPILRDYKEWEMTLSIWCT